MALTSLTALWALEDTARLRAGETILIQGGAGGGVGGLAILLAKYLGARVITTASARNHDYVRGLGTDRVIDYEAEDFTTAVHDCDVVFDTVGGDVQMRSYAVLKPGGRLVWIAPAPDGFRPTRKDVETLRPAVARDRAHLERMLALLEQGAVWPPAITRFKLTEAADAHRVSEGRHLRGPVIPSRLRYRHGAVNAEHAYLVRFDGKTQDPDLASAASPGYRRSRSHLSHERRRLIENRQYLIARFGRQA